VKDRLTISLRATFTGMAVNAMLTAIKFVAGITGHSHALVADAVESLADIFSSIVVWRALVVAAAPADDDHPYGHGKAEPLAAAMVSTMLLGAAGWIAITAAEEIRQPHQSPAAFTLLVLLLVIVVKETLFRYVFKASTQVESTAVASDAWHHRSDAITSAAAAVGITVALLGGPRYAAADDWAALLAAGVIAFNGARLLRGALNELMDRSPSREFINRIREVAQAAPGVEGIEKCFVRKMGFQYFVDIHVEVEPEMTVKASHAIAHAVKGRICSELPAVYNVLVHIEPAPRPAREQPGAAGSV
jgi:cation diffusion facilitator family transporter